MFPAQKKVLSKQINLARIFHNSVSRHPLHAKFYLSQPFKLPRHSFPRYTLTHSTMSYNSNSKKSNDGQDLSDNYSSGGHSESSFFDDATWSLSPSPDMSTDAYESSPQPNTNTHSSSAPNPTSTSTPDPEDANWKFFWAEDLLEPRQPRKPTNRTCPTCLHTLSNKRDFEHHIRNAHINHACPTCLHTLSNKRDFEHHIRNAHINHACPTCHKQYSSARYLQEHVEKSLDCSPAVRASSACPVCGERFGNWAEKNRHYWEVHVKRDIRPSGC